MIDGRIEIVKKISEFHPSNGVDIGWAEHTGGMKDTGQWFVLKMLSHSEEELQAFLNKLNEEKNCPVTPLTEQ